ncbi:intraflagellar transport protein 74-like [Tropilaelaps mercedesae]|uniref:Intraflagellar transport protein 74-like n=1 Tax=Tropilaelaps mercedesae TaxID=418985 RepID=A0A1V9X2V1_9ACAR|nr:intraflagellar transport protein 74-like [Tropilaelaps mercedesae]
MDNRPLTSSARRPPSGFRPFTGKSSLANGSVPGTASRLVSAAANQRPGSRSTRAPLPSSVSISDRPTTQHGLYAPKTGTRSGTQRQIQDKPYFMALIRNKMSELYAEITRLRKENDRMHEEQRSVIVLQKKAESLASELKALQGELADYNIVVDKMNINEGVDDIEHECNELKIQNDQEAHSVETLFEQRQENEAKICDLEREILDARNIADNMISQMKPDQRQKYVELMRQSESLTGEREKLQEEAARIVSKRKQLEEEVALSQVKLEAVALYTKLREVREKKEALLEEEATKGTPAQERERLLKQVKQDNAQLAGIEAKIQELTQNISRAKEELGQLDNELEDQNSERTAKYRELKKREETMDAFLDTFDQTKAIEIERQEQLKASIQHLKQDTDQKTYQAGNLPSQTELHELKSDLSFKEGELEKSKSTISGIETEQRKLSSDLQKIEQLDVKVRQELNSIKTRLATMKSEMRVYEDIDCLKAQAHKKRESLIKEQESLVLRKDTTQKEITGCLNNKITLSPYFYSFFKNWMLRTQIVEEQSRDIEGLRRELEQDDTFTKLAGLERRWQHVEANNQQLREAIAAKVAEHSWRHLQQKVQSELAAYNELLQDSLVSSGPTML